MYLNPGAAVDNITNPASFEAPSKVETPVAGSAETSNKKKDAPAAAEAAGSDDLESFLNDLEI